MGQPQVSQSLLAGETSPKGLPGVQALCPEFQPTVQLLNFFRSHRQCFFSFIIFFIFLIN